VSWDRIVNPVSDPDDPNGGFAVTIWQLIEEVPPNVTALANTATTGLYVVTDAEAGASVTREFQGTAGEINIANGSGVGGNPTASLADVSITTGGTLKKYGFDAKGRLSQSDDATTTDLTEGTNLYFTAPRAQAAVVVSGITDGDTTHSPSGDAVFDALALKADASDLDAHETDTDNPHEVTAAQVGLGNVDNTSDADKPVSTAQQTAIDALVPHGAMAYLSSAIALASGDTLLVPFSAASFDDDSWWSSGSPTRLTVPTGVARVRIVIAAGFAAQSGGNRIAYLSKNGNANFLGRCSQRIAPSGGVDYLNASTGLLTVSPGDYFELAVSQNSGSAVNVQGTPDGYYTWLAIEAVPAP
jgi:hypothetical protein